MSDKKVTIKDLLEAGVHFGHQVKRWNPRMKNFVYGARNGIYIIDLTKTMKQLADACNFLQHQVMSGGKVLFVGTKRQAQQVVQDAAEKTDMYYVSERWLGGTLTNNVTIRQSVNRMLEIDKILESDSVQSMKKKEVSSFRRKSIRLHKTLDGIFKMKDLPDVLVLVDVCHEDIAVKEAQKLNIPIVALVDTNGNPDEVDYPIPANDDAVRSIQIIIDLFADAICVANEVYGKKVAEEKKALDAKRAEEKAAKEKADQERKERATKEKEEKKAASKKAASKKAAPKRTADKKDEGEAASKAVKAEDKSIAPPKAAPQKAAKEESAEKPKAEAVDKAEEKVETADKVEEKQEA